jgi:hypothetical protein
VPKIEIQKKAELFLGFSYYFKIYNKLTNNQQLLQDIKAGCFFGRALRLGRYFKVGSNQ